MFTACHLIMRRMMIILNKFIYKIINKTRAIIILTTWKLRRGLIDLLNLILLMGELLLIPAEKVQSPVIWEADLDQTIGALAIRTEL